MRISLLSRYCSREEESSSSRLQLKERRERSRFSSWSGSEEKEEDFGVESTRVYRFS
jgi:hypothetical protein